MKNRINKLKKKYGNRRKDKVSYREAHIIDYFLCIIENWDRTSASKRKDIIPVLYGIAYGTFKEFHKTKFQNVKGFPNIEIEPLEMAIIYVDYKIENKINPEFFTDKLLKNMYDYHQNLLKDN